MKEANARAERRVQAVNWEDTLDQMPLWRQKEMNMRVFIVVAIVVKIRRPASKFEVHVPLRGSSLRLLKLVSP